MTKVVQMATTLAARRDARRINRVMNKTKSNKHRFDLNDLSPSDRKKVMSALPPGALLLRDQLLSLRFKPDDIWNWKGTAEVTGYESLTDLIEEVMNKVYAKLPKSGKQKVAEWVKEEKAQEKREAK